MELVAGETLHGPLLVETALNYGKQIAEALEYAHERGVVHRDLKPANIKVTPEGCVKVLDFGLAKAMSNDAVSGNPESSPTLTMRATMGGVILGTAGYMSPEQARGQEVDRRADIWAFGAVLFEMVAGRPVFQGESVSDILASVLKFDPDWKALPAETPKAIRRLLERCLTKDRKQRPQAIGEARILEEYAAGPEEIEQASPLRRHWLPWAVAGVCAACLLILAVLHFRERAPENQVVKLSILPPEQAAFGDLAISPDRRLLAFTTARAAAKAQLWVRPLDSLAPQPLAGTKGASYPFWSPDSRYIAFFADDKLKKYAISGGPAMVLCDAQNPRGGTWHRNGVILFGRFGASLYRVPAGGGEARPVTNPNASEQETAHRSPFFLPDGRHFLYTIRGRQDLGIYLGALDTRERVRLLSDESNAAYVKADTGGYVIFWRSAASTKHTRSGTWGRPRIAFPA
jgi:hypothetical protein